jgi:hypothetical protein
MKYLAGIAAAAVLAIGTWASQAHAGLFDWTYSDQNGNSGSGTLTTNGSSAPGTYTMLAITGTYDGSAITGIAPPGTCCSSPPNDNNIFIPAPYLDLGGIGFFDGADGAVNIYLAAGPSDYAVLTQSGNDEGANGNFTLSAPEPVSLSLFGFGLVGLAFARRRRRQSA